MCHEVAEVVDDLLSRLSLSLPRISWTWDASLVSLSLTLQEIVGQTQQEILKEAELLYFLSSFYLLLSNFILYDKQLEDDVSSPTKSFVFLMTNELWQWNRRRLVYPERQSAVIVNPSFLFFFCVWCTSLSPCEFHFFSECDSRPVIQTHSSSHNEVVKKSLCQETHASSQTTLTSLFKMCPFHGSFCLLFKCYKWLLQRWRRKRDWFEYENVLLMKRETEESEKRDFL